MKRRDFLRAASVPAAAAATSTAAGVTAAQESGGTTTAGGEGTSTGTAQGTGTGTSTGGSGGAAGGATETVAVGPGGSLVYTPGTEEPLEIAPGTTVEFVWESDNHNIVVDAQPDGANWEGHEPIENTGFTYSHTFDTLGEYEYHCAPHQSAGMVATLIVTENPGAGGGEGGGEKELEELGVPIQAHWVGAATILGIIVTVIFTFYILKYGESPNTGTGRNG
jgi:plastocyanin